MPAVVRRIQTLEEFSDTDRCASRLLEVAAFLVVFILFILNFARRVPSSLRLFPFFLCTSACTHLRNDQLISFDVARPACHPIDWSLDSAPALPSKKVDFDPVVPGVAFDCEEHRWCRSTNDILPGAPLASTSEATGQKTLKSQIGCECTETTIPRNPWRTQCLGH